MKRGLAIPLVIKWKGELRMEDYIQEEEDAWMKDYHKDKEEISKMNNADRTPKTGIFLNAAKHAQLMKEIITAPADKGMWVSIGELKELQKVILKDVKMLNRHILKEEFLMKNKK